MHQLTAEPRTSIYYRYQVFGPWLPSAHPPPQRQRVVIAGAGPAGLVTALELARHGVPSVVLEAERLVSLGSRAIVFSRRSTASACPAQRLPGPSPAHRPPHCPPHRLRPRCSRRVGWRPR